MDAGVNWLWQGSAVALALAVMLRLLERARANVRYVVCWAALLLILLIPARPWLGANVPPPDALSSITADVIVSVPDAWWTSGALMTAAWMVWASVYIVRFVRAIVALRRARTRSRPFPSHVESRLYYWRHVHGAGRCPALVLSDAVPAAAVLGCGAPLIAVAPSLVTTLEADELDRVVIHEWAHVQRRDDLVSILQIVIRVVAGWHPAVWWIERRLHVEREMACDEMTVAITGSPKSYAECLLKLASLAGAQPALAGPAVLTASGLRARVTRIVSRHAFVASFWSRGIAAAVVCALCLVSLGVGGLRLVEVAALALPSESIRIVNRSLSSIAPIAAPILATHFESARSPGRSTAAPKVSRRRAAEDPAPGVALATPDVHSDVAITPEVPSAIDSTMRRATESGSDAAAPPEPSTALDLSPTERPNPTAERGRSPWVKTADGGKAIGRKSKDAGVATAGFFTRFARRVAGSF